MHLGRDVFGVFDEGRPVHRFTITNANGARFSAIEFGAILTTLEVPDRGGALGDIVLGLETLEDYVGDPHCFGAVPGRYANRIARAQFTLDGTPQLLHPNEGLNCLHGGLHGFHKRLWRGSREKNGVRFSLTSEDGDQGFPGRLETEVTYVLDDENILHVTYRAHCDQATVVNLTQHSYFNLDGHDAGSVLNHELMVDANSFTLLNTAQIPTGEISDVAGTPFDFRTGKRIGRDIASDHPQLKIACGYDQNWVINSVDQAAINTAARLASSASGRVLEVFTDQPGIQVYTGNALKGTIPGKNGARYGAHSGICLETQHYPDSPNHPHFPSTILRPGEVFESKTRFEMTAE